MQWPLIMQCLPSSGVAGFVWSACELHDILSVKATVQPMDCWWLSAWRKDWLSEITLCVKMMHKLCVRLTALSQTCKLLNAAALIWEQFCSGCLMLTCVPLLLVLWWVWIYRLWRSFKLLLCWKSLKKLSVFPAGRLDLISHRRKER